MSAKKIMVLVIFFVCGTLFCRCLMRWEVGLPRSQYRFVIIFENLMKVDNHSSRKVEIFDFFELKLEFFAKNRKNVGKVHAEPKLKDKSRARKK